MICPTSFSLTDAALDFLLKQASIISLNNIDKTVRISLNNIRCYTCDQTLAMNWKKSIVANEINFSFPRFNYLHLRLIHNHNLVESKYFGITSAVFQKFALVTNLNATPLTINFYNAHENYNYFDNGERILYPQKSKLIYSMEMLPLTLYLIDQSVPHNYTSVDSGQIKIFSAANKIRNGRSVFFI